LKLVELIEGGAVLGFIVQIGGNVRYQINEREV